MIRIIATLVFLTPLSVFSSSELGDKECADKQVNIEIAALDSPNSWGMTRVVDSRSKGKMEQFLKSEIKFEGSQLLVGKALSVKKVGKNMVTLSPNNRGRQAIKSMSPGFAGELSLKVSCACTSSGSCGWYQDDKHLSCTGPCSKCEMGMTTNVSPNISSKL